MSTPPPTNHLKVLLVDDNTALLQTLQVALEALGPFAVTSATNGADGLERYFEVRPDCIVIDVKMPELDGYQLVRALRGDPDSAGTPLVMLTALGREKDELAGMLSGADIYLIKPVPPQELVAAIRRAVALSDADLRQRQLRLLDELPPETR
jgi:two-component system alkaline phosphatase synthesis response regulator PhoP